MIPNIADRGTSFNGVAMYLLRDKKDEDTDEILYSSNRVDWTATRNFFKDDLDPWMASKVMAATAMDQDRLKREAGVRASGQKSKGAVLHYSIAWHPDEDGKIDKAEMLKAVDQSLEALGAENHQSMIVCHNDEGHPHAHVLVNLVSPEDGRNLSLHADYNKLEDWALAYRRSRNEEHLYVPSREEKAQAKEARKAAVEAHLADCEAKGIEPDLKQNFGIDFVRGQDSVPRHMLKDYKRAARKDPEAANRVLDQQRQLDKDLAQSSILEREGRAKELDKLQSDLTAKLGGIDKKADSAFARSKAQIDKKFDAKRADLASQHYQERTEFEQREERLAGKIQNAVTAIVNRRETDPDSRGIFGAAFNFLTETKARFDALDKLQRIDRHKLNKSKREEIGAAKRRINTNRAAQLNKAKSGFQLERNTMLARHANDKREIAQDWNDRAEERKLAFEAIAAKRHRHRNRSARAEARAKEDFNEASKIARKIKRGKGKGRSWKIGDD